MFRNINLVFIFLLLSIYTTKKLKTSQNECKLKYANVTDMNYMAPRGFFISEDKLFYFTNMDPAEIKGINPKHVEVLFTMGLVIDTNDKLRLLTPDKKTGQLKISSAETYSGTFENIMKTEYSFLAIRKKDGAIMKLMGKDITEIGASVKNLTHYCSYKNIYVYTEDKYFGFMNPMKSYAIEKILGPDGKKIEINPNSELSCTDSAVFYGAKGADILTYYNVNQKIHFKTKLPINYKIISMKKSSYSGYILNDKHEWQECPNILLAK